MAKRISQSVCLTPEQIRFIEAELASGRYATAVEVIGEGLRRLQDQGSASNRPPDLRVTEGRFRALVEATSDVTYRMSPDWSEMRQLHGGGFLSAAEEPTTDWLAKYIHPDDQPRCLAAIREAIRAKAPFELEHRVRRMDGTLGWTFSRAVPILGPDGEIAEWFGVASDVTERKRTEEALHISEARLRMALDAGELGGWEHDLTTGIVQGTRKHDQILGYDQTPPQWSYEAFLRHVVKADREEVDRFNRRALQQGIGGRYECRIRRADGIDRWIEVHSKPEFDDDGRVIRLLGTIADITRRKQAEQELRRAKQEAERANLAKSKFLAAASHDLRQPLQSLLLFLDVLKPHVAADGLPALNHLERGLDALTDLLNSLLDISRLDAGVVAPTIEDFAVQEMIEPIVAAYLPVAAGKGLALEVTPSAAVVHSDRTLLGRILRNLVENALRYTDAGRIAIECHRIDQRLRIEVRDTGVGIAPEHLDLIWEEFHQVGNPERDRGRGLGLGLSIVRRLSDLLDHPVHVGSLPGKGSVFSVEVPLGEIASAPDVKR